ncbi:MAG: BlaI/MecI/CopY family transcriptional regulator [candidate division Zixibacteria bacterium]
MKEKKLKNLSRRERQIMEIMFRQGSATAGQIHKSLPDPPSYSSVRAQLRILEEKNVIYHEQQGPRYIYFPKIPKEKARTLALKDLMTTFFNNSAENVISALINMRGNKMAEDDYNRLLHLIEKARTEEK